MEISLGAWSVRSWRQSDAAALVRYANNRNVWRNLRDSFPSPYTAADARRWLRRVLAVHPETEFAIAAGPEAIGAIGLQLQSDVHRYSAEIGYWIGEPYWGRGVATLAVRAVTRYAFEQFGLVRLYATVFEWNRASMRVLEKAGYRCEGRLRSSAVKEGRTIDEYLYACVRPDAERP